MNEHDTICNSKLLINIVQFPVNTDSVLCVNEGGTWRSQLSQLLFNVYYLHNDWWRLSQFLSVYRC